MSVGIKKKMKKTLPFTFGSMSHLTCLNFNTIFFLIEKTIVEFIKGNYAVQCERGKRGIFLTKQGPSHYLL